ncbi:hypothetical protein [Amphiplicatus metriothermophilus]|uniref:Uncharacterized protein n=1 Tax=Amphiplicatus metriothermophilus TaxID=1519374 RepID=A0A239PU24_9PROT|nr:hypothetical protein [Amphiplicatus metriothermophilus]MBB5519127.1 hypothetical protein [Amphiplicatus metriothermophilus]SNT73197.1 hypothetical protein SAMN06297382_1595 [Amphiplicatus metriothermophilus]
MEQQVESIAAIAGLIITLIVFTVRQHAVHVAAVRDTYMKLELSSNEIFRFEADKAAILAPYHAASCPALARSPECDLIAENFYLQQLNLFEVSVRFRKNGVMEKSVFGSWVAWYYEVLTSWHFRELWPDLRLHYTPELRAIFDDPVATFDEKADDGPRRRAFFAHVAKVLKCRIIRDWLDEKRPGRGSRHA